MRPASGVAMSIALIAIAAFLPLPVCAEDYPSRMVRIIDPYVASSTTDVLARALSAGMGLRLCREFIVDNRPGAGGAIGTRATRLWERWAMRRLQASARSMT
jgi:tripartite-type tricarboxylate transporter receptor subunit TctC